MGDLISRHSESIAQVINFGTTIHAVSAEGLWVTDVDGNRWADFACGTAVVNLGHNHPEVIAAAKEQMDRFVHSGAIFRYEPLVEAAEALKEITPPTIDRFGFANSGAEAVEASVKLAKYVTGRQGVVTFRGGFHGRTMGSVSYTTSKARYRDGYHPVLGSTFVVPFPHAYAWGMTAEEAVALCLREIDALFEYVVSPSNIACFLIEPVQGEGGYYPAPPAFLSALRSLADEHGILLIYDEVQSGMGRTASWFAADHYQAKPDVIAIGKGIANGLPLSAYGAASDLMDAWPPGAHGTTFGGNPVSTAAAVAVIETMGPLLPHARTLSERAFEVFGEMAGRHPTIGEVRGLGLMIGVELVEDRKTRVPSPSAFKHVQARARENNMVIISCGSKGNVIRFIPPLVTTMGELEQAMSTLDDALWSWERGTGEGPALV
jgi:4-aminobutyrate aminotransferase